MGFFIYLIIAAVVGTIQHRVCYKKQTPFNRENDKSAAIVPGVVVGVMWPIMVPAVLAIAATNKLLDKLDKV